MTEEVVFTQEQQALVDKLVGEARVKAREKAKTEFEAAQATANEEAEREKLAAGEEWQKLASTHEARVKELEPLEAQVKAYGEVIAGMLKDKVESLGNNAKKAIEGLPETMTDLDKLNWLNKNEGLFQAESASVGTPKRATKRAVDTGRKNPVCKFPLKL
ncbi:MAG: hypothetical protein SXV54_13970 [Chloroflexota bacterium]|nr:hypothetical protein [Chloroflexota bacterium]